MDSILTMIKKELHEEEASSSDVSQTSWKAIFSKEHRARTFVAVLGLQSQNFSGGCKSCPYSFPRLPKLTTHLADFANTYQTYYFELIGQSDPFQLTAISSTLQFLSNFVAVGLSDIIPRRKGLIGGGKILMFWSVIIAATSMAPESNSAAVTALLAFVITWSMLYTATVVSSHPLSLPTNLAPC